MIAAADARLHDIVLGLVENLRKLADGGFERIEDVYKPARPAKGEKPNPRAKPKLVLVERKVTVAEPDRAANIYLLDRVLGRPRQSVEVVEGDGGPPKRIVIPDADDRPEPDQAGGRPAQAGA